jgi:hypothetical protein
VRSAWAKTTCQESNGVYKLFTNLAICCSILLNDLLTFSKNQIGQQLSLEEKEFRLVDIKTQILTIFMKQVQEGKINFGVQFLNSDSEPDSEPFTEKVLPAMGPQGAGRLKDMQSVTLLSYSSQYLSNPTCSVLLSIVMKLYNNG